MLHLFNCTATLIQRQLYNAVIGMICAEVAQERLLVERLLIEELKLAAVVSVGNACHKVGLSRLLFGLSIDLGGLWTQAVGRRASHAAQPGVLLLILPAIFHNIRVLLTGQHGHHVLVG